MSRTPQYETIRSSPSALISSLPFLSFSSFPSPFLPFPNFLFPSFPYPTLHQLFEGGWGGSRSYNFVPWNQIPMFLITEYHLMLPSFLKRKSVSLTTYWKTKKLLRKIVIIRSKIYFTNFSKSKSTKEHSSLSWQKMIILFLNSHHLLLLSLIQMKVRNNIWQIIVWFTTKNSKQEKTVF